MASSSSSSPAFSSQLWNYDVFLSFRGEDTRKNFVDHLYAALVLQGIETYKDDETLRRGETIRPALMKAIVESQIAIIIFSKNYADSSWCLDELEHIMKCKETRGQIVMPVFYGVEPSEVRKQTKIYGEAFVKHKLEKENKVESWKKVLEEACNLSGWEPKNIANGHESKVIKEMVDKILLSIELVTSCSNEKLVGMPARVQRLKSELRLEAGGVRMVGIWGVGGGGKTTLASCIYNEICRNFEGCCFIANIREESRRRGSMEELKTEILSKMGANTAGRGRCLIDKRFRNRKVLIVLDDVDQRDQLQALAESPDWFGEGSRIIITTRDEHLLKAHNVVVHDINLLQGDEALKLFCKHAFRGSIPTEEYEQLSKKVVSYAGGLPLALTVLGSSLCDKNIPQWRSALARLKKIPDTEILEKLKVSFDGLRKVQKDLFLDIACFYRWENIDMAMESLDACGFDPVIGLEELRQKALITISDGKFDMHDLMQEMGHYIVRGEHPKNPEKHSRIWKKEDILTLCAMDATMELDKIEAISGYNIAPPIVVNMRNLCYIRWKGDPANPTVNNFPPMGLCCLILSEGVQDQLWNGFKYLPNLKMMELSKFENLIVTPNFDGIPFLEKIKLFGCPKLKEVHSSFGGLKRLVSLRIEYCSGIKKFPSITQLKKLKTLSLTGCPRLIELSQIQQKTDNLFVDDMSSAIQKLSNLYHIQLYFSRMDLRKLNLSNCNLRDEAINSAVWELPNLQELDLYGNKFSHLNFSLIRIPRLKFLDVSYCSMLKELVGLPSSIAVLRAKYCKSLSTCGDISNCKWLWKVLLEGASMVDIFVGWMLLDSMLEGNAIGEDHFISVGFHPKFPVGSVNMWFIRGNAFTLHLPHDWYHDFCGCLIHVVTNIQDPKIDIIIKQEVAKEPPFEVWRESDEEVDQESDEELTMTYVGYVSFNSLRHTASLHSTCKVISISVYESQVDRKITYARSRSRIGAELVPRKSKDDVVQITKATTGDSEFWGVDYAPTFTIKPGSEPSIRIIWQPLI